MNVRGLIGQVVAPSHYSTERRSVPCHVCRTAPGCLGEGVSVTDLPEAASVVIEGPDRVINLRVDRDKGVVETDEGQVVVRPDAVVGGGNRR